MKKVLAMLLAMVMVLSLCACAANDSAPTEAPAGTQSVVPQDEVLNEITLPLCENKEELTVWLQWTNQYTADPNALEGVQYLEELTNVHINWIPVTAEEVGEKYQLLKASDNLPDIIVSPDIGMDVATAVADGWAMDMSGLIARFMPNYRAYLAAYEKDRRVLSDDDGVVRCFANVAGNDNGFLGEQQWAGLAIRSDLIEKAGYTGPLETIEDYHNMLLTCKKNLEGLDAPLYLNRTGYGVTGSFLSAYGVTNGVMSINNVVSFGPIQKGYGQWLEEMRTWFAEGLIDPNFETVGGLDGYWAPASVVGTNKTVCFTTLYNNLGTAMPMVMGNITDPTAVITPVLNPVLNSGDQPMLINVGTGAGDMTYTGKVIISADCKNPELAAKWLDFMLTEQAMVASHYGKEGVSYELDTSEGAPFKYVYKEGYQSEDERVAKLGTAAVGYYNWSTGAQASATQMAGIVALYAAQGIVLPDNYQMLLDAKEMWTEQGSVENLLYITLNEEESNRIATIKADIETRVSEYTVQYIKGQTNESFADFVAEINNMQVDTLIAVYQGALDRFLSK